MVDECGKGRRVEPSIRYTASHSPVPGPALWSEITAASFCERRMGEGRGYRNYPARQICCLVCPSPPQIWGQLSAEGDIFCGQPTAVQLGHKELLGSTVG